MAKFCVLLIWTIPVLVLLSFFILTMYYNLNNQSSLQPNAYEQIIVPLQSSILTLKTSFHQQLADSQLDRRSESSVYLESGDGEVETFPLQIASVVEHVWLTKMSESFSRIYLPLTVDQISLNYSSFDSKTLVNLQVYRELKVIYSDGGSEGEVDIIHDVVYEKLLDNNSTNIEIKPKPITFPNLVDKSPGLITPYMIIFRLYYSKDHEFRNDIGINVTITRKRIKSNNIKQSNSESLVVPKGSASMVLLSAPIPSSPFDIPRHVTYLVNWKTNVSFFPLMACAVACLLYVLIVGFVRWRVMNSYEPIPDIETLE